ncbi:glycosyl hydrolase catalytic core-domain-containing protein [Neohortaea acidophila]|uniref:Glycosyl hydrolase catalytic core-domain-containing protein n=1 Tax=Neohortaea acidophila TaxID=245834 RepID=A0A6A6PMM4_9PEZI|nr:glycosyl hydrolase catalytic core-domain-containing protein [Neohortaea acidophila]KAF2480507.1 glycosyl hydrolase catalytic core-domain-containing protein [Neohortaea acidophila]
MFFLRSLLLFFAIFEIALCVPAELLADKKTHHHRTDKSVAPHHKKTTAHHKHHSTTTKKHHHGASSAPRSEKTDHTTSKRDGHDDKKHHRHGGSKAPREKKSTATSNHGLPTHTTAHADGDKEHRGHKEHKGHKHRSHKTTSTALNKGKKTKHVSTSTPKLKSTTTTSTPTIQGRKTTKKTTTTPTTTPKKTTSTPTTTPKKTTSTPTTTPTKMTTTTSSTTSKTKTSALPTPTKSSGKRGLSFNDPYLTNFFSLQGQNSQVTWSYNWASDPYYGQYPDNNTFNPVIAYSPMLWSNAQSLTSIWSGNVQNAIQEYGSNSVLGFNEPDECCCGSSCMNVSVAVSAWQQYIQPLAGTVQLGAPAVTNAVGPGVGVNWLSEFMGNCTGCSFDFIPLHWYGDVSSPSSFTQYVQSFHQQFNKPLWITEFGTNGGSDAQIISFLENVMPWLDSQTYVVNYAYFGDFAAGSPYLLNQNDTLTDIGVVYNSYSP